MPGEVAPAHRHVASALRFVLESGGGGYTAVDGERSFMAPGDFVITPSWTWHDHGNSGDAPVIWLDCLDVHVVNLLDSGFREDHALRTQEISKPAGASMAEAGLNLLPIDYERRGITSPLFNYPYLRTREALDAVRRARDPSPAHGFKMRYVNPLDGGWAIPTIATWMQLLPQGFVTTPARSTDGTIFVVVEGTGTSTIGSQTFSWVPNDVFVVPSWTEATHRATAEAVLFGASDRVIQEKLGLWRELVGVAR
jgi:gentisate 1,2-dioxygenase